MKSEENNLLKRVIGRFQGATGIEVSIQSQSVLLAPQQVFDALISIKLGHMNVPFVVEVKKHLSHLESVRHFISKVKRPLLPLILAETISPDMKEHLRLRGVAFLADDGDFFLPLLNYTQRDRGAIKPSNRRAEDKAHRIHGMGEIKLGFALMRMPQCRAMTLKELSQSLKVSLGSVSQILRDWEKKHLIEKVSGARRVVDTRAFSRRWATAYVDQLKYHEFIFCGCYSSTLPSFRTDWKSLDLGVGQTWWGGEPGASLITHHLEPEIFQVYFDGRLEKIISKLRLKPNPRDGNIFISRPFWSEFPSSFGLHESLTADPLVVYADLIYSQSSRNQKVAEMLLRKMMEESG